MSRAFLSKRNCKAINSMTLPKPVQTSSISSHHGKPLNRIPLPSSGPSWSPCASSWKATTPSSSATAFQQKYGTYFPGIGYQLTAPWQAGLGNASGVGAFFGVLLNGYLVNKFGQKRVLLGALAVLTAFIAMTFRSATQTQQIVSGTSYSNIKTT